MQQVVQFRFFGNSLNSIWRLLNLIELDARQSNVVQEHRCPSVFYTQIKTLQKQLRQTINLK